MAHQVVIPKGVYGFPDVGFGGFVAGLLAAPSGDGGQHVDFHRPAPLGVMLTITEADGRRRLEDGEGPIASARPAEVAVDVPAPPTWDEALRATGEYVTEAPIVQHDCYGCGPRRAEGEGLRQFLGLLPERGVVAAAWRPAPALGGPDGALPAVQAWAALDCPAGWARFRRPDAPARVMTANLAATLHRPIIAGERHVAFGWVISRDGRKTVAGSAVATADGELCAVARSLWIDAR
ncbi:PaaI family thioesterase [Actinomadura macrotermitis]|uniref:Thioesterase family protein n=1 Tax=Actinomadura macrotermitis TaxID=2585200 RepID=A0A7K0BVZ4_9ACTN|nr:hypothetical protein [Actinomadura macrotermitis]MQY05246.1 hypothetical protein [Actinomadura macrotermitis]